MANIGKSVVWFALAWAAMLLTGPTAEAYVTTLPTSAIPEVLSETVPTAFAPNSIDTGDFAFEWVGKPPGGVTLSLAPESLQWVRVMDVLVLPRARLVVDAPGAQGGRVSNAGFSQAFGQKGAALHAEMPIALVSGDQNTIDVMLKRGNQEVPAKAVLKFKPRALLGDQRVFFDPSCSRFGMRAEGSAQSARAKGWAYVGCRVAEVEHTDHRTSSLETFVFWDGMGQTIRVGGVSTPSSSVSIWPLRLRSKPGETSLQALSGDTMTLKYSTPDNFHRAGLGVGIGPYTDHFVSDAEGDNFNFAPVLTIYGSYFVTESMRVVAFDAVTLDSHLTTDVGFYLNTQYLKVLDNRLIANLMLGVHFIGFNSAGKYNLIMGLPQGTEITFVDAFKKGHNLTAGAFYYPLINGEAYYNFWLRWGSARFFGEFNFISWRETINSGQQNVSSTSAGISVGFPFFRFF